jgi:hypothetical protein
VGGTQKAPPDDVGDQRRKKERSTALSFSFFAPYEL